MPTYNYRCAACGAEFERVQRMSEDPIKECLKCGKPEASRQIIHGNFILKGGGWYGDLYSGSSNKKSGSLSESSSSSSTSTSSSTSSTSSTTTPSAPAAPSTSGGSSS
ncbi:MAG: zinc ribbon domain-containing protein [Polyangiales bacterium]